MSRRRSALLRHRDAASAPPPRPALFGHNGGPAFDDGVDPGASYRGWCWRQAAGRAWKTPPREIALRRLARAEAPGMTYRAYALEIMERGRHL
jgi:hypothetical protein